MSKDTVVEGGAPLAAPLAIRQMFDVRGATQWTVQPSVMLLVTAVGPPGHSLGAHLMRVFEPLTGVATTTAVHVIDAIGRISVALLKACKLPVFEEPTMIETGAASYRLLVPSAPGQHATTRKVVEEVVRAANALAAAEATEQALAGVQALLDSVRRQGTRGKNTLPLLETAHRMRIPWHPLVGHTYRLGQGRKARWFNSSITNATPNISVALAKNKHDAAAILRQQGIPVPDHRFARSEDEAVYAARRIGFPVVVKPADLDQGAGVAARLMTEAAVRRAWQQAAAMSRNVLVERHCFGEDHRLHVFEGEVYRVRHRIPGGVTGDGVVAVDQLLARLNADPARGAKGSDSSLVRIDADEEAMDLLAEAGLELGSVPAAGQFVQLRRIANVSVGGLTLPVPIEHVHPDNLLLAARAVKALKLDLAAVDLLIPDIRRSWLDVGAAICEVNAQPQFGPDVPEFLFGRMFPDQGRVPVVAVVGRMPEGWVERLRRHVAEAGVCLGWNDGTAAWSGSVRISAALPGGAFQAARVLLGEPDLDALLMVPDLGILSTGLPTDRFDALVIGAPGHGGAEEARLAEFVAPRSDRIFVLEGVSHPRLSHWRGVAPVSLAPESLGAQVAALLLRA